MWESTVIYPEAKSIGLYFLEINTTLYHTGRRVRAIFAEALRTDHAMHGAGGRDAVLSSTF